MGLPDLTSDSVSIVIRGAFNPAIFSPAWLFHQKLIGPSEYDDAKVSAITREVASFEMGWLNLQVTLDTFQVGTSSPEEFERTRDVAVGVLQILRQTPVSLLGINRQVHFTLATLQEWHNIGDTLVPKEIWEGVLRLPGMRAANIQGVRPDRYAGQIGIQVEPSQLVPQAVYVAVNDHFGLKEVESQPASREEFSVVEQGIEPSSDRIDMAMRILSDEWLPSMRRAQSLIERVSEISRRTL
jgi:hypothetical protein